MRNPVLTLSVAVLMSLSLPAFAADKPTVELLQSNGDECKGEIVKADGVYIYVKTDTGAKKIHVNNIVEMKLSLLEETPADAVMDSDAHKARAKILLDNGLDSLAIRELLDGLKLVRETADEEALQAYKTSCQEMLKEARIMPPRYTEALGGKGKRNVLEPRAYDKATPAAVREVTATCEKWGNMMGTPSAHCIPTDHFYVFSTWPKGLDKQFAIMAEKTYQIMTKTVGVDPDEHIYVGRVPMFLFYEATGYVTFLSQVFGGAPSAPKDMCIGFWRAPTLPETKTQLFSFIVSPTLEIGSNTRALKAVQGYMALYVPVGFYMRYAGDGDGEGWLRTGFACMVADMIFPGHYWRHEDRQAAKMAVKHGLRAMDVVTGGGNAAAEDFDYHDGICKAVVKYLVAKDPAKFRSVLVDVKAGTDGVSALQEAYGMTLDQMEQEWTRWAVKTYNIR
jgi:hypothetical protein